MKATEFREWFTYATKHFPEMAGWVNRHKEHDIHAEDIYASWEKALDRTKFSHAKVAIDAMLRGDIAKPEYGWSDMPKLVNQYSRDLANAELSPAPLSDYDQPRKMCPVCNDAQGGFCLIWNPYFVQDAKQHIMLCNDTDELQLLWDTWRRPRKGQGYGGLSVPAICNCDSRGATFKRNDYEYRRSDAQIRKRSRPPTDLIYSDRFIPYKHGELEQLKDKCGSRVSRADTKQIESQP